jgi:penicillin amidase
MKLLRLLGIGLAVLVIAAWAALRLELAASRPQAVGRQALAGLGAPVTVERDAAGVVTLTAADRTDLARATGFVHAQERFFQMDLLRRDAAGELAALVGPLAVERDRARRLHRMRAVAERTLARAHAEDVALIEAYAAGVNAGLAALGSAPYEYLILRQAPAPWRPVDSVLVSHAMWFDLTDEDGRRERDRARLVAALPPAVVELLMPRASSWDSPLRSDEAQPPVAALPGPEVVDLRTVVPTTAGAAAAAEDPERERLVGSNNFAVGGALTADGRAILAGDMHLGHAVPNIWFRLRLRAPGLDATGVTLPGVPVLVAGSNGKVAWAFTNSYGDWTDLRRLEVDGDRYRTAEGWAPFERVTETIAVARGEPVTLEVRATRWGPVFEDAGGAYAIGWLAHRPEATNLELLHAEQATSVAELVALAPRLGIPPQNMAMADAQGHVGWTIAGRIPQRDGWREASDGWTPRGPEAPAAAGFLDSVADLAVVDPPDHRIWTANGRVASGAALVAIGDGGYDLGARARQIRDGLRARERFTERDLLAIQLDDRALFLAPWRELLLATLAGGHADAPLRAEARRLVEGWSGRAAVDDAGYRIVRGFRLEVRKRLVAALEAPLLATDPEFAAFDGGVEGAVWRIVTERPAHLLPGGTADWDGFLLAALDASLPARTPGALAAATWGQANRARIRHPLSAIPTVGALYDMPATPLPGDHNMPRVQARAFGASQRMVVAPGREADGYFHMPAGQSGHPLVPYYAAGHADWAQGRPSPFLPGPTRWTLTLIPGGR